MSTARSAPATAVEPTWDDIVAPHAEQLPDRWACGCRTWQHLGMSNLYLITHDGGCAYGRSDADLATRPDYTPSPITRAALTSMLRGVMPGRAYGMVAAERDAEAAWAAGDRELGARLTAEVEAYAAGAADARAGSAEPFTVPPAPASPAPSAPSTPLPPVAQAAPLSAEQATLAEALRERASEAAHLQLELSAYLSMLPADDAALEVAALMAMTLADRAEAIEAARSGRLHRLGITCTDLVPGARNARQAWIRLREGAAGVWSISDLTPFSDEEMQRLLNPERPRPVHLGMFYERGLHILAGSGGIGKTWIALAACAGAVPAVRIGSQTGPDAVYLDMDNNYELYSRASDLGVSRAALQSRQVELMQVGELARERGCSPAVAVQAVVDGLVQAPPRVVVVDSLTRLIAGLGESSDDNDAATRTLQMFDELAAVCCVIVLDHTGHEHARPRGASAKKDASRVVLTVAPASLSVDGFPEMIAGGALICGKDRDGGIRAALADPADKDAVPELGLVVVNRDVETGATRVEVVSKRTIAEASARRESDEGQTFATEARKVIRRLVDAAARNAVTAEQAKARGCKPVPPLSARGIEDAAWDELKDNKVGGRKSDVRAVIRSMTGRDLVEYQANWGSTPGVRYRLAGGITDGHLDPVDLD